MVSNQIKHIMLEMGYSYNPEPTLPGYHEFLLIENPEKGVCFRTWAICESWMRQQPDFRQAQYENMRKSKQIRKLSKELGRRLLPPVGYHAGRR